MEVTLIGEQVAGESSQAIAALKQLIRNINSSGFDLGEALYKIRKSGHYGPYQTYKELTSTLDIKASKLLYLPRIAEVMDTLGIPRAQFEQLGIAKMRAITSLDPEGTYHNPVTEVDTPMKDYIIGFVQGAGSMSLKNIQGFVKTLKGLVGENAIEYLTFSYPKNVLDTVIRPALELAKANIGSVAKDEDGNSLDASDSRAFELIAADFLAYPSNGSIEYGNVEHDPSFEPVFGAEYGAECGEPQDIG
jgi:hypothetical protein